MTISSLNTNLAALVAQLNIGTATTATQNEVAQLSSGNRIVQASTDVAALATGTALASQVNTLNTSLTVASQGSSLLQVADGGLAQIQTILQRQQAIATQAQSGSLSSTQLGFLDQEFQQLSQQIDQLASTTNFNGVNLLNGSISGNAAVNTNTNITSTATSNYIAIGTIGTAVNGDTLTVNGVTVTFTTASAGTSAASGEVVINGTAANTSYNLVQFLNNLHSPQLANLQFTVISGAIDAVYTGGALQGAYTVTSSTNDSSTITGTGSFALAATQSSPTSLVSNTQGVGLNRYSTSGSVTGSLLVTPDSGTTNFGSAVDVSAVANNLAFIGNFGGGSIGDITGTYTAADTAVFSVKVGDITYNSTATALTAATPTAITFKGADSTGAAAGGSFTLNLAGGAITAGTINSQTDVNNITQQLNTDLSGVTVNQNRTLTSFEPGNVVTDSSGTQIANFSGAQVTYNGSDFSNVNISSFTVAAPATGSTDAKFTAVINGDTYVSAGGIGNQFGINSVIGLQDTTNPNNYLAITLGNTAITSSASTAVDVGTASKASLIQSSLDQAFGLNSANAALSFQVGSSSTDTLGISIGNASTSALFNGQSLDVKTQADAATASTALTSALNTVTALRANVGALEERFNYASNALSSASQNEGAAESTLLDTDVASTSTSFATSQVQLQAGIAVLAQANQLQQNLLKLIS